MRVRRIYVQLGKGEEARKTIEATPQDFSESLRYARVQFSSQEDFLHRCCRQAWIREVNEVLQQWIPRGSTILSVGSGLGEHEVLLFRLGYEVTASDFVAGSCSEAVRLFPGFSAVDLDILHPILQSRYDTVLMLGGMDQYFDDASLEQMFQKSRDLLKPRGRLIFAMRHHDNLCTRLIDYVLWPVMAMAQNIKYVWEGRQERWTRKVHAYARSRMEVIRIVKEAGYRIRRIGYAGFGVEWTRLAIDVHVPRLYARLRSIDQRLHCCNNVTLIECVVQ